MLHSLPGWQMKYICHTHRFYEIYFSKSAFGKGLEGVEVGGKNQGFSVLKQKQKVVDDTLFV